MSTLSGMKSKIAAMTRKLNLKRKPKISVVFYDSVTGEVDWPPEEECNRGVLLAPRTMTVEEWEKQYQSK